MNYIEHLISNLKANKDVSNFKAEICKVLKNKNKIEKEQEIEKIIKSIIESNQSNNNVIDNFQVFVNYLQNQKFNELLKNEVKEAVFHDSEKNINLIFSKTYNISLKDFIEFISINVNNPSILNKIFFIINNEKKFEHFKRSFERIIIHRDNEHNIENYLKIISDNM